jgi:predicted enzyme related to lactoylglutathione lyase
MLTTHYVPGSPCWIDLGAPDVEAAAAFYGGLFGWNYQPLGPEAGGYGFFSLDGRRTAAVGPLQAPGLAPSWTVFFQTADADATAKAVTQSGGGVSFGPHDVFTNGRMARCADPGGAEFSLWEPRDPAGLDVVTDPGSFCWAELHAENPEAARAFYTAVFGWDTQDVPFGTTTYTILATSGGGQEASFGGLAAFTEQLRSAGITPGWVPYFEVTDCEAVAARAAELGGQVAAGPHQAPGIGTLAHVVDPGGAPFALITSASAA